MKTYISTLTNNRKKFIYAFSYITALNEAFESGIKDNEIISIEMRTIIISPKE